MNSVLPVEKYGGTQRIMWWLAKEYHNFNYKVTFLAKKGTTCPFADVVFYNPEKYSDAELTEKDYFHIDFSYNKKEYLSYLK